MGRDILRNMKCPEPGSKERRVYTPCKEKLVDSKLVGRLLEHYTEERDREGLDILLSWHDFESEVKTLASFLGDTENNFHPQLFLNALTHLLKDESEISWFSKTQYLTAVVQALYDLNYNNFVIDVRGWPEEDEDYSCVGWMQRGEPDKPLILNLYGKYFWSCGNETEYCNFILHDVAKKCGSQAKYCHFTLHEVVEECGSAAEYSHFSLYNKVEKCGPWAENSVFTLYDEVYECGSDAKDCTFNLMPGGEIEHYCARPDRGNVLRRLKENGEWEIILPAASWY